MPQPFTTQEIMLEAQQERQRLFVDQEPVSSQVTLYEAMARAVMYNLDHQVKQVEEALARGNLVKARYDLLPQLVTSAGYSGRSNENGSASKSLLSGTQSLEPSTSQEKSVFTADIIHVWNVLDFGVGYTQALQRADEVLIAEELRRKAVQNIVQDVRYAFWRAVSAEMLLPKMDGLLKRVESALDRSRKMEKARAQDPAQLLAYQQELLETVKQLWDMRRELSLAKTELAALINLDPGTSFRIGLDENQRQYVEQILSIDALEEHAMTNRPELRVESYNKRISSHEVRKTMLSMLPGLEINLSAQYDDNQYLYNSSWLQAGLRLSWNAFNLLSGPEALKTAKAQQDLAQKRYMATAMMVLAQVNLAHQRYALALKEFQIASQLDAVHQRKLLHAEAAKRAKTSKELEEIRNLAGALSANMNRGLAFSELQGSLGRIFHSIGIDPLPATTTSYGLHDLAHSIEEHEKDLLASLQDNSEAATESLPSAAAFSSAAITGPANDSEAVVKQEAKKETAAEISKPDQQQTLLANGGAEGAEEISEPLAVAEDPKGPAKNTTVADKAIERKVAAADLKEKEASAENITAAEEILEGKEELKVAAEREEEATPSKSSEPLDTLERPEEANNEQPAVVAETAKNPDPVLEEEIPSEIVAQDVFPAKETEIKEELPPAFRVRLRSTSRYPLYIPDKRLDETQHGIAYRSSTPAPSPGPDQ